MKRVRVRRDHPYAPAWTLVMLMAALTIYLISETMRTYDPQAVSAPVEQVSYQLEPLTASLIVLARARDESTARIEAARYVSRGAAGYILPGGGEYLIIGALYDSAEEAGRVLGKLSEAEQIAASIATREAPGLLVRLTGTRAQSEALLGAESALRSEARTLGETAFKLDSGDLQSAGARDVLLGARQNARRAREALEAAVGGQQNPASAGIAGLLAALEDAITTMLYENQSSPLFFSGRMKYTYIDLRLRHIELINRLAGGDG
jgi:hypothetical protein